MAISDVIVNVALKQAATKIGFGVPGLFVAGAENTYKEYARLDDVMVEFGFTSNVYRFAKAYFAQADHPDTLAVITYNDISAAYAEFTNKNWYFGVLADPEVSMDDVTALSNLIEEDGFRMLMHQINLPTKGLGKDLSTLVEEFANNSRSILVAKRAKGEKATDPESDAPAKLTDIENIVAPLLGRYGAATVGSVNWHDLMLDGVSADSFTTGEMVILDKGNFMTYVMKTNGVAQTSQGKTMSGQYIDVIMGIDWTRQNIQMELQNILTFNDKVPFNAAGIALLTSATENVLNEAHANGIVDEDDASQEPKFTVSAIQRDRLKSTDIANRAYKGLSYEYTPAGAIDTVVVRGTINF